MYESYYLYSRLDMGAINLSRGEKMKMLYIYWLSYAGKRLSDGN